MRWRRFIGPALVVAAVLTAVLWWQAGRAPARNHTVVQSNANRPAPKPASSQTSGATKTPVLTGKITQPGFQFLSQPSTNAPDPVSTKPEDRFKYRLTNTRQRIAELTHNPKAILLENALFDTSGSFSNLNIPSSLLADGDPGAYIVQSKTALDDRVR